MLVTEGRFSGSMPVVLTWISGPAFRPSTNLCNFTWGKGGGMSKGSSIHAATTLKPARTTVGHCRFVLLSDGVGVLTVSSPPVFAPLDLKIWPLMLESLLSAHTAM
ncbi:hypothetical protein FFZ77_25460 [Streptomyces katsurahamanus]|uniref:Uncharacterized protein n=1 Tax=Streptomyces katsurahamanus TaxID=2577098 RepID=A0ABW9NZQ6_9ACTN|nr:hypothetical protein [Streptomyces katsurahamanus]